jgi:hypothetical protein
MTKKVQRKRLGPFKIIKWIGELNYQLRLPLEMKSKSIRNTFHVNLLTKSLDDTIPNRAPTQPPPIEMDSDNKWEVEHILDSRVQAKTLQYLVKWNNSCHWRIHASWQQTSQTHQTSLGSSIKHTQKPHNKSVQQYSTRNYIGVLW